MVQWKCFFNKAVNYTDEYNVLNFSAVKHVTCCICANAANDTTDPEIERSNGELHAFKV